MKKDSFIYPIVFMVILTVIFTFALAFLNFKTEDIIAYNESTDLRKTILYVFDIKLDSEDPKEIEEIFNNNIEKTKNSDGETVYVYKENDDLVGYAFEVGGTALWGTVEGYAAVSGDYNTLLGIDFVSHSETPGLGGRISEDSYKEQFRGLDISGKGENLIVYRPSPNGNVDAIAGATQTSKSVSEFLNKDIYEFISKKGGTN